MTEPLAIPVTALTFTSPKAVTHVLELAQARVAVDIDRDITPEHRLELVCLLGRLRDTMAHLWRENPGDGDVFVMDLRRDRA